MIEVTGPRGALVAGRVVAARTFWGRLRGLMWRRDWEPMDGLLIEPCDGVHTFFVRFPIEVVFLDSRGTVLAIERLRPNRLGHIHQGAERALELPWGTADRAEIRPGDVLSISELTRQKKAG